MANLENNSVDTRTFPQFCAGLTKRQWIDMQTDLVIALRRTHQCIYNWKRGYRVPGSAVEKAKVSNYINRKFNANTRHWTLFPDPQL
jgi:hypothetical protein